MEVVGIPRGVGRTNSRVVTKKGSVTPENPRGKQFAVHYTPQATRVEASVIRGAAQDAMGGRSPFDGPLCLKYVAYVAVPKSMSKKNRNLAIGGVLMPTKKPDFDNMVKFIDALKQVVFVDDALFAEAHIWKRYSDRPRIVVEIRKLLPPDAEG